MAQKLAGNIVVRMSTGGAADQFARDMAKAGDSTKQFRTLVRGVGGDMEYAAGKTRSMSREAAEYAAAIFLGAKALAAQTTASTALEAALNRVRAARVGIAAVTSGLGGAAVAGAEIAAVVAVEKLARSTFERAKELQQNALAAAKTGFSIQDTGALGFAAARMGKPPDYYDSAVKSAGGVDQLAKKLRELAAIEDPLARAKVAFDQFGPDAEKVLANLGDRFGENIERAREWGFALDEVSRGKIDGFNRDITALKGSFDSLTDAVAASKQTLLSLLQLDIAGLYDIVIGGTGDLIGKVRTAAGNVINDPNASFKQITKGAESSITGRASADALAQAQKEMLASLTAPAEKSFNKSYFDRDQEADLRAEIADLQKRLFVQDRTSPDFGKLTSGASFPGGYGAEAESVQKLTSDQGQLARVLEHKKELKDADEAAKKAAEELAAAQRSVAAALESAQLSELSGADKLRAERDYAIQQYGKTKQLISDINKEFDIKFGLEGKAIIAQSDADMKARAAAEARAQETQLNARTKYTSDAILGTIRTSGEAPEKRDEIATQGADVARESQLRQLESFNQTTLAQKTTVEAAKFQIESSYFTRIQEIESQGIARGYEKQLQDLKVLLDSKLITEKAFNDQKQALDENEELDLLKLHEKTDAEIQKSGVDAAKAIREAYQQEFAKIDEAVKSVLSRISGNLASLVTGQKTSFGKMFLDMGHQVTSNVIQTGLQRLLLPLEKRAVAQQGSGLPGTGQQRTLPGILGGLFGRGKKQGDILDGNGGLLGTGGVPGRISGMPGSTPGTLGAGSIGKPDGSSSDRALWVRMATDSGSPIADSGGGSGPKSPVTFGNGGLLGTGQVPKSGDNAESDSGGDAEVKQYDEYGFRIRPQAPTTPLFLPPFPAQDIGAPGTGSIGSTVSTGDTLAGIGGDPATASGAADSPFMSLSSSLGGFASKALSFGNQKKVTPKMPGWMKWLKLGIDGSLAFLSPQFAQSAINDLNSDISGGGGGSTNVSSNISYDTSDDGGDDFGGGLATGGPVKTGKHYIVGERGPELFRSGTAGHIVDHETTKRLARAGMLPPGVKVPGVSTPSPGSRATAAPKRLTPRADGGDISAGDSYMVGERGPELFTAGGFSSDQASRRTPGNGGNAYYYSIDARGTDPVQTEQRVKAALVAVHGSAVSTSIQGVDERQKRTPQRS